MSRASPTRSVITETRTPRIFPYRDYVIQAFNDNKRFDQFTREQLAGDLLPNPTEEQHIATGFLRLNLMTREGGAQPANTWRNTWATAIRALGGAWLGLTTGCAECHDHKFDPITAKDYYSLGAFFADIRQWGVYSHYSNQPNPDFVGRGNDGPFPPEIHTRSAALEQRIRMLQDEVAEVLAPLKKPEHDPALDLWTTQAAGFLPANPNGWSVLKPVNAEVPNGNQSIIRDDGSVIITGEPQKDGVVTVRFPLPDRSIRAIRFEALPDEKNGGRVGRDKDGTLCGEADIHPRRRTRRPQAGMEPGRPPQHPEIHQRRR